MTPAEWERMPWHARARHVRGLAARERRLAASEEALHTRRQRAADVEEAAPTSRRDDTDWQREHARFLLRHLPADSPAEIQARRDLLDSLTPYTRRGNA